MCACIMCVHKWVRALGHTYIHVQTSLCEYKSYSYINYGPFGILLHAHHVCVYVYIYIYTYIHTHTHSLKQTYTNNMAPSLPLQACTWRVLELVLPHIWPRLCAYKYIHTYTNVNIDGVRISRGWTSYQTLHVKEKSFIYMKIPTNTRLLCLYIPHGSGLLWSGVL